MIPSAPTAAAARASGSTRSRRPAACDGIDDHRQVRLVLEHRNRAEVERVPGRRLEGLDPALAEDDPVVALLGHVLGGHQQLLDRGRDPALEQHRLLGAPDLGQQQEVLAVARADLDHVRRLDHLLDVARVHQLGHDRADPSLAFASVSSSSASMPEALERVRRGARLERSAAEHRRARGGDDARRLERLLAAARRGKGPAISPKSVSPMLAAVDLDHGRVGDELSGDEPVRLE